MFNLSHAPCYKLTGLKKPVPPPPPPLTQLGVNLIPFCSLISSPLKKGKAVAVVNWAPFWSEECIIVFTQNPDPEGMITPSSPSLS